MSGSGAASVGAAPVAPEELIGMPGMPEDNDEDAMSADSDPYRGA